jgi:hypothetical protein
MFLLSGLVFERTKTGIPVWARLYLPEKGWLGMMHKAGFLAYIT